jgi:CSLREA domain-containing protein
VVTVAVALIAAPQAAAAVIKATTTDDGFAAGGGCSLREAIYSANTDTAFGDCTAGLGADEVRLTKGSVYGLSIAGRNEDGDATGDLDVTSAISIGPKSGTATIDAFGIDRVMDVLSGSELSLSRTTVTGGFGQYPPDALAGAGIRLNSARLTTSKVKIMGNRTIGNSSNNGGGLLISGTAMAMLDKTTIKLNGADNVGGGISMYSGTLKLTRSTVQRNQSGYVGGGLYLSGSALAPPVVSIKDSAIHGNSAGANGGGVYFSLYDQADEETARLTNTTVSGNFSDESGGGLYGYVGRVSLNGSTVAFNTADADSSGTGTGGGLSGLGIPFLNSIVADNSSLNPADTNPDCGGSASSLGHNVTGPDCGKASKDTHKDPKLRALKKNGGPTVTHALGKRSSAIGRADRKSSPKKDQRGVKRDKHPDSGAFERVKGKRKR